MRKLPLIAFILLAMVSVVSAETLSVPSTIYSQGEVSKPSSFTVNLTVNPTVEHVPIDVVLAIDCSPSMERYSKVIYGPTEVNITKKCGCCCGKWVPIANFTLDEESNVEILLSYSLEDYYNESWTKADRIDLALDNPPKNNNKKCGGCCGCKWEDTCEDPAAYIFENVPAGTHTIYAKLYGKPRTEIRVLIVALPPSRIDAAKNAAENFVGLLKSYDRAGIVRIGSNTTTKIELHLTSDKSIISSTISNLTLDSWICIDENGNKHCGCCGGGCGGCGCGCKCKMIRILEFTSIVAGLEEAYNELKSNGRQNSKKVIILLSDGENNNGGFNYSSPLDVADLCAKDGIVIYTIGFGVVNESLLREIAKITGGNYYYAASEEDLKNIYEDIYKEIEVYATNITLTLNFNNPNITYVSSVPTGNQTGNIVSWQWNELKNNTSITVWINSSVAGEQTVASGNLKYYDYYGWHSTNFTVIMNFTVPIPTPTPTLTPTPTPTPTVTPIVTPTLPPTQELVTVNYKHNKTNMYMVIYKNTTPPEDVGFKIELNGKVIDSNNDSFILTYFRENDTTWILEITPQYTFTNNLTQNYMIINVSFYDDSGNYLNGTNVRINKTDVTFYPTILNTAELNNLTIRRIGDIGYPKPLFVGEKIKICGYIENATRGNVTVNNVNISYVGNQPTKPTTVVFIPNAAGYYTIEVNAINVTTGNVTTLKMWKDVPIRLKPIKP